MCAREASSLIRYHHRYGNHRQGLPPVNAGHFFSGHDYPDLQPLRRASSLTTLAIAERTRCSDQVPGGLLLVAGPVFEVWFSPLALKVRAAFFSDNAAGCTSSFPDRPALPRPRQPRPGHPLNTSSAVLCSGLSGWGFPGCFGSKPSHAGHGVTLYSWFPQRYTGLPPQRQIKFPRVFGAGG